MITRHKIRQMALQVLFALDSSKCNEKLSTITFILNVNHITEEPNYLEKLVNGVLLNQLNLDNLIRLKLDDKWTVDRLNKIDLVILRISLYEIKFEKNVPNKVALDEALQLAKEYSNSNSKVFINGILSNYI